MKMFLSTCGFWLAGIVISLGATQLVTTTNDDGDGSLRAAIANAAPGDSIKFDLPPSATIELTSGELLIAKSLTITGPGSELLTVKRNSADNTPAFPIFHTAAGPYDVSVSSLTVSNGRNDGVSGSGRGGGFENESLGQVTLTDCIFKDNVAYYLGGGVSFDYGNGVLNLTDCLITQNTTIAGFGGGLAADVGSGTITLFHCTVSSNTPATDAGGIYNAGAEMTITESSITDNVIPMNSLGGSASGGGIVNSGALTILRSTIANNRTERGNGGGVVNQGILNVVNSSFFGNSALQDGGGLFTGGGTATISNSTFTKNVASQSDPNGTFSNGGGGISHYDASTVVLKSTIVAGNISPTKPDLAGFLGAIGSGGYNLIGDDSGGVFVSSINDLVGVDPLLGNLSDNGGPTQTVTLLAGSPALDAGDPNAPPADQRGYDRQDARDIGAFEVGATIPKTLANISTRLFVGTGDNALIGGFIITGTHRKEVLLRAIGPSLSLSNKLENPFLELHDHSGAEIAMNDDWQMNANEQAVINTGIPPTEPLESALLTTLDPGAYTVVVRGAGGGTGIALVEAYDLDRTTDARLANISTRGLVQGGDKVMIGGFIVLGSENENVLLRAIGPSLPLSGALPDPSLELHDADGTILATNDNWRETQEAEIAATGIPPENDAESALVRTLPPGEYTAIVRGAEGTSGVALVEAYGLN